MKYLDEIHSVRNSAQQLEMLYQAAKKAGEGEYFQMAMEASYRQASDHLLFEVWHHRLAYQPETSRPGSGPNWKLAVPVGVATGLIFWLLSDPTLMFLDDIPYLLLFWAPLASMGALAFLAATSRQNPRRYLLACLGVAVASIYVLLIAPGMGGGNHRPYLELMQIHLPLLCWMALGFAVLGRSASVENRFTFLIKSIEVAITAGLFLIFGVAFGGITTSLFMALNIQFPDAVMRLIILGGFGLLPVLALASMYDPALPPEEQDFSQGLSKFIAMLMRLLLPLTLLVLTIYVLVIPFNFMQPFKNRELLIVYNLMLFAIVGLLIGVTPVNPGEISARLSKLLRRGILAAVALTVLVSIYALSAVVYRTFQGGLTINRLTITGWNTINIALLVFLLVKHLAVGTPAVGTPAADTPAAGIPVRSQPDDWSGRIKQVFGIGMASYVVWEIFLIVAIPLLFR